MGISIPSAVLDKLNLRDDENPNKSISLEELEFICKQSKKLPPINNAESERLTIFLLSNPDNLNFAHDVFDLLDHGEVTPQTLKAASKCLRQLASSMNTGIARSVVAAAAAFANPKKASSIIDRTNSFLEGFLFSEQVAKAGRLAATLAKNKASQKESGALDEVYVPCGRER